MIKVTAGQKMHSRDRCPKPFAYDLTPITQLLLPLLRATASHSLRCNSALQDERYDRKEVDNENVQLGMVS
jgi:hypothetical protein